ncbi:hypothetical protein [Ferrovum myxofaciens]|uniref:hypothetical protein n=1 Tax=Ferrovum myxofaciens TaxID=416213 RepID=UPI001F3D5C70|nr:hypothetical protein [Ferrovum myxofaciens]
MAGLHKTRKQYALKDHKEIVSLRELSNLKITQSHCNIEVIYFWFCFVFGLAHIVFYLGNVGVEKTPPPCERQGLNLIQPTVNCGYLQ